MIYSKQSFENFDFGAFIKALGAVGSLGNYQLSQGESVICGRYEYFCGLEAGYFGHRVES